MRPIDRGTTPILANGQPKIVANYRDWRKDLIDRLGAYCCYCNMKLNDSPQVEHVIAQNIDEAQALVWDNMLLACGACNRAKSNQLCSQDTHYLPQFHNTHLIFEYFESPQNEAAFVKYVGNGFEENKANNTIEMLALNRDTTRSASQATDLRWKYRWEAIFYAKIWRQEYDGWANENLTSFIPLLKSVVEAKGFWSVWYQAFCDVLEIRQMLVLEFSGTALHAFDEATFLPI